MPMLSETEALICTVALAVVMLDPEVGLKIDTWGGVVSDNTGLFTVTPAEAAPTLPAASEAVTLSVWLAFE